VIKCIRRIQFCAGHRVWKHENKCAHLHGHNYVALLHATAPQLDTLGRIVDFSYLKESIGAWIETHWDHGFILYEKDTEGIEAMQRIAGQKLYLMQGNPTAENMAAHLLHVVAPRELSGTDVQVVKVELWETENCYAEASL
jgi:6-pyruvoyltetrahydropterin/6-carboxytetrahydropterin synthase